ncbi:DUF7683 domain-containing protein [Pseudomonas corrugata]|uniref:DUF7683 domain-containing protein n=1 Tax=Pseudomonas corrugata TaxID=47879 RepID=UPI003F6C9234
MIFEICAYDKITEDLKLVLPVPLDHLEELRVIMNWVRPEDELFVYNLTHSQIIQIENMINKNFYDPKCDFQISSHLAN